MSLDKKIQETFNPPPSLEGEDWLMPSEGLFDSIEEAIYEDPKKKRRPFWIWLLPIFLISVSAIYLTIGSTEEKNSSIVKNGEITPNHINSNVETTASKVKTSINEGSTSDVDQNSKTKSIEINSSATTSGSNSSLGAYVASQNSNRDVHDIVLDNPVNFDFRNKNIDSNIFNNKASTYSSSVKKTSKTYTLVNSREKFDYSLLSKIIYRVNYENIAPVSNLEPSHIDIERSVQSSWKLRLSSGVSNWNFDLNNNYLTALQPADFSFTNGKGYYIEGGVEKRVNNRLSFGIAAMIDRNTFDSGHNSVVDYNIDDEILNHTNGFDLTMASPLGFLESNIVVARNVDASTHTDLIIDLDNKHTVTNLDFGFYAQFDLLKYNKLSVGTQLGSGLSYIYKVTNTLNHFSASESGFDSHSSMIIKDQSGLNLLRPYFSIGMNVEYLWSNDISIGLNYQYRQDINAIYQSGDFSTIVSRQLSGFYISKSL